MTTSTVRSASQTWKNLLKSINLITHWLCWNPGFGHSVIIGKDCILGLEKSSFLSPNLITFLNIKNIRYLYQARGISRTGFSLVSWITSDEIGLIGDLALGWDVFCRALSGLGVKLQNKEDELMWNGGDKSRLIFVKNVYTTLTNKLWHQSIGGWRRHLWFWNIAQKIRLFTWLAIENKILTWDILQQKGWEGPSICQLCSSGDSDTVLHLFVKCSFTRQVWDRIKSEQKLNSDWEGNSLTVCYENWAKKERNYLNLPSLLC
jgi:hypothetical protein